MKIVLFASTTDEFIYEICAEVLESLKVEWQGHLDKYENMDDPKARDLLRKLNTFDILIGASSEWLMSTYGWSGIRIYMCHHLSDRPASLMSEPWNTFIDVPTDRAEATYLILQVILYWTRLDSTSVLKSKAIQSGL